MAMFCIFFMTFMYYRSAEIELFNASQKLLSLNWGAINTLLLLASSWFVVLGLNAVRRKILPVATWCYSLALTSGLLFGVVKIFEWREKITAGYTLTSDNFFMFYYVLTGVHLLHVIIGIGVLCYVVYLCKQDAVSAGGEALIEGGSAYWHMVDLLWIVLFPMLYMVR
jgi:nitric oxide reductase NorE protein